MQTPVGLGGGCVSAVKAELGGFAFKTSFFYEEPFKSLMLPVVFFFGFFLKTRILDYSSVRSSLEDLWRQHCHWESRSTDQHLLGLMTFFFFFVFLLCQGSL